MKEFFITLIERNSSLAYFGLLNLAVAGLFIIFACFSNVKITGQNAWFKPTKFALSLCIYAISIAWYSGYIVNRWNVTLFNVVTMITLGFEVVYIAIQAARGDMSHFNVRTPFFAAMYSLMAGAAAVATIMAGYAAVVFFREGDLGLPPHYLWSIRLGLILFVIFSFEGFLMGSRMQHSIGGADGGAGLKFLGWSVTHGDARIAHFVGMHALQILPLFSFYILRSTPATLLFSVVYALVAVFVLVQALAAQPFQSASRQADNQPWPSPLNKNANKGALDRRSPVNTDSMAKKNG